MKKWILTASTDGNLIDWETVIESDTEPDFWTCYNLAAAHGCDFFTIDEMEESHMKLYLYCISADHGESWTEQWLTPAEAAEHQQRGYIIQQRDAQLHYMEL